MPSSPRKRAPKPARPSVAELLKMQTSGSPFEEPLPPAATPPEAESGGTSTDAVEEELTLGELAARRPDRGFAGIERPSTIKAAVFSDDPLPPPDPVTGLPITRPAGQQLSTRDAVAGVGMLPPSSGSEDGRAIDTFVPLGHSAALAVAKAREQASLGPSAVDRQPLPSFVPDTAEYAVRIQPLAVFRYPGYIAANAPAWIDRNWIGYAGLDEVRNLPAGPALNIPGCIECRVGSFVVMERVTVDEGLTNDRLTVYEPDVFFNWFAPLRRP